LSSHRPNGLSAFCDWKVLDNFDKELQEVSALAKFIRVKALSMVAKANSSHIGSCLSVADIIACVQTATLKTDDLIVFSKGHAAAAFYASLAGVRILPTDLLDSYGADGSELIGHVNHAIKGVSFSTGSLGHGFPIGLGAAIASKNKKVFVIISDGELNEGTTWESLALAGHLKLNNLTVIVDMNGIQSFGKTSDVINLDPLNYKFTSFGWNTIEVDGHSIHSLFKAIDTSSKKPKMIIAKTIKGKGIKVMEGKLEWHYRAPSENELPEFIRELDYVEKSIN